MLECFLKKFFPMEYFVVNFEEGSKFVLARVSSCPAVF